jgi:acyl-CoA synthetase (AMP-forming)/AMP-acid ligase II
LNDLLGHPRTLAHLVQERARRNGSAEAFVFLGDGTTGVRSLTWDQLDRRAACIGNALREKQAAGRPVLLAMGSGLGFVESLFGCWYAAAIAVPVCLPRHQRVKHRLDGIINDAGAKLAIGTTQTRLGLAEDAGFAGLTWIDSEKISPVAVSTDIPGNPGDLALLQYTSGSTGQPRGVMVTHANFMHNSAMIAEACGHGSGETIAGWLPLFHDMGLVGLVLQAAYSGARCVFMSPERFLMRPRLWLQMISDYGACSSPAPNFAYDYCVDKIEPAKRAGLNLSRWRNALNGSEPVRAETMERFAAAFAECGFDRRAIFPCYGLAEATLFVTGPGAERGLKRRGADGALLCENHAGGLVGCGRAFGESKIAIVDPTTSQPVEPGRVGEIWLNSASVASGYWKKTEEPAGVFGASVGGEDGWLRTGDLGFIADGELFISGRMRELVIFAGRNLFPVDLECTVEASDPAIGCSASVAFSVDIDGAERLVLVAELRREVSRALRGGPSGVVDIEAIQRRVRAAVTAEHEVPVHDVVLLGHGELLRTTSGKVSRLKTRDAYLAGSLEHTKEDLCASTHD